MKRSKLTLALVAGTVLLSLVGDSGAADFSPTIEFTLDDNKALANPIVRVVVKQDTGEEELQSVELRVPAGFTLAGDAQLQDGEDLGEGTINIDVGPRCAGAPAGSAPGTLPVSITERNRRANEIADNAIAVYHVDVSVTSFDLVVKGNPDKGYTLAGPIPGNSASCPPFTFNARFFKKAASSGTAIFTNPQFGGSYTFEATFKGLQGGTSHTEQAVTIDGPSKSGDSGSTTDAKKKCKKIKNKKKRKRCLKKLRG
jgi:hypothetical protein